MMRGRPRRIVCLSTETVEVLYALGEQDRIVGISGYTVFPPSPGALIRDWAAGLDVGA